MEDITVDWFVGFLEGEGSFSHSRDGGTHKFASFQVSQNNKEIFERIRKFLGFGSVYFNKSTKTWYLQVRRHEDSLKLIQIIDGRIRSFHKLKQYEKWKALVLNRKLNKRRWNTQEEEELKELIRKGFSYEEISSEIRRSPISVRNRNWIKFHIPYKRDLRYKENKNRTLLIRT